MPMCFFWLISPLFRCQPTGWLAESGDYISYSFFGSETLVRTAKVGFVFPKSVHNLNPHLELQNAGGPCQVIVSRWETHQLPRSLSPSGIWSQNSPHVWVSNASRRLLPSFFLHSDQFVPFNSKRELSIQSKFRLHETFTTHFTFEIWHISKLMKLLESNVMWDLIWPLRTLLDFRVAMIVVG